MTTNITEYFNNTKLIKFQGFKNNSKAEGPCIIGYLDDYYYYYEEVNFINDKKEGPYKKYYDDGKIYQEGIYINDLINGPYKGYYGNGNIYEEVNFIDNKKNGPYKIYYTNGNIFEEGIYENNEKIVLIKYIIQMVKYVKKEFILMILKMVLIKNIFMKK